MSVVYRAERFQPFAQTVAIKVLQRDAPAADLLARFDAERRILASLDHHGIVRILDGGVTEDGRPFLAMEHIAGERIDAWCDRGRLTVSERLTFFREVLDAVSYAHRALVVHRDLKPSNILVTETGEVRLLDFGIARILEPDADAAATLTGRGALTPEYASPEQIRGERVTTSSDVYALGVLLYELLTGRRPYALESPTPWALEHAALETEPERPSDAVARVAATDPDLSPERIAIARSTEPARLRSTLDGDLDAIILKALRKEPDARYASVDAFAEDIDRYLGSLPVLARRGSRAYHVRKFVRRHRTGVPGA
jgi:serine/threonine-protein kinase